MNTELSTVVNNQKGQFDAVVADKQIEFAREAQFAMQILSGNKFLATTAMNNQPSLIAAVLNIAAVGISLNPASKLAYLVPRDGKVCLDISYMGLLHIAQQSGAIKWGQATIVRKNDTFELQGIDSPPKHEYNPFGTDRGECVGVFAVIKTDTGDYLTHAMPIGEVYAIRDRSPAWKKSKSGPWATDPGEMVKKTCIKQASKYWPRRDRLDGAIHHMNTDGGEGITLEAEVVNTMPDAEYQVYVKAIEAQVTKEKAKVEYKKGVAACNALGDKESYDKLKAVLLAHADFIDTAVIKDVGAK